MNTQEILNRLLLQVEDVKDETLRATLFSLLNLIEGLATENSTLHQENQRLRDEINRLKGEQGTPKISADTPSKPADISSENERKAGQRNPPRRGPKKEKIRIDRTEICQIDPAVLPQDAEFKGYERVIIQDVKFETDNIEFHKEVYYSPSQKLERFLVAQTHRTALSALISEHCYDEEAFQWFLSEQVPSLQGRPTILARVKEASAIAAYHQGEDSPVVQVLVCDDAPQFKALTDEVALCWVHDGRFYKKLRPVVPYYARQLEAFLTSYWAVLSQAVSL